MCRWGSALSSEPATLPPLPWSNGAAFIDGAFCPIQDAKLSVLDMGVTRSDCTYDVVHVWKGQFFRLDDHLDRFLNSTARLRLDIGRDRAALADTLHETVRHAGLQDAYVSMTCTRGRPAVGSRDLRTARNNFYCFVVPFIWLSSPEQQVAGTSMWISESLRIPPSSVDPSIKNYHWLDLEMAQFEAYDNDSHFVVLRNLDGSIAEGAGYNVFAFVDGSWVTPSHGGLRGVTRKTVLELIAELGHTPIQGVLTADQLRRADEIITTTTAGGVMPITVVDGRPVGSGSVGPKTQELHAAYWARHGDPLWSTKVRYAET